MARGYNDQFVIDIQKFATKSINSTNDTRKFIAAEIFEKVIDRTPIHFETLPTSGNTKFNWTCTINTISTRVLKGVDQTGDATKARMMKVLERATGDDTIYFSNSVSWIFQIEDGLYPKNPVLGSWNPQTNKYEIRSSGGFSKLAPQGMVKVTLAEYPDIYRRAIRKAQRNNR